MENAEPGSLVLVEADFRTALATRLREHAAVALTGAQLAPMIQSCLPQGTTFRQYMPKGRSARLLDFVQTFAKGLVQPTSERRGADIIYRIEGGLSATTDAKTTGQLWKSFVALEPTQNLVYDRELGVLHLRDSNAEPVPQLALISPVTISEHQSICVSFLRRIEADANAKDIQALREILANYQPTSYPNWLATLRSTQPPMDKSWGAFRQTALLNFFRARLSALELTHARVEQLTTQLRRDQEHSSLAKHAAPTTSLESLPLSSGTSSLKDAKEKRARDLLHAAIDRMTPEQLNSMLVPFGLIVEVLSTPSNH